MGRWVDSEWTVPVSAFAVIVLRLAWLPQPLRPDEAGFLLVARSWSPAPDSVYGPYFVDRAPQLLAVLRAVDALTGPLGVRMLGAFGCAALVLLAAYTGRLLATPTAGRWTALAVAAVCVNPLIDATAVKGELLGVPWVLSACVLALLAVREPRLRRAAWLAAGAGLAGSLAVGFKQSLVDGLAFAGVLLAVTAFTGSAAVAGRRRGAALLAALAGGALVPVLATVAWALASGVHLGEIWYAVAGFRGDATRVLADRYSPATVSRAQELVVVSLLSGLGLVLAVYVGRVRHDWRRDTALTAAVLTMLAVEAGSLVMGGSYWRDYLFPLMPGLALVAALVTRHRDRVGRLGRALVALTAVSALVCSGVWLATSRLQGGSAEQAVGRAVGRSAEPGDTLVVFGGRSDVQWSSRLTSPYPYLWSLVMRVEDPQLAQLRGLVASGQAPTWIVEAAPFDTWQPGPGDALTREVSARYVPAGGSCDLGWTVWRLRTADRAEVTPRCP